MRFGVNPYSELEKALGHRFRKRVLLEMALTHRSYRFEHNEVSNDNQRLEFLGDAILGFLMAEHLYEVFDDQDEGVLTSMRSRVASGKALTDLARSIRLGDHLLIGKGEEGCGGRQRASNLADAMESVLGAVYLDAGLKGFRKVFNRLFVPLIENLSDDAWAGNPKGRLQEYVQSRWKCGPVYKVVDTTGPSHATIFTVEVSVDGVVRGRGTARSKQDAERIAAKLALKEMAKDDSELT